MTMPRLERIWEESNRKPVLVISGAIVAGVAGFGCAIGIHYPMGYLSGSHLAPAWTGAAIYIVGIVCYSPRRRKV